MYRYLGFSMMVACILALWACDPPAADEEEDEQSESESDDDFELEGTAEAGESKYDSLCASCHGAQGDGAGPAGAALDPPPTDFTQNRLEPGRVYAVTRDGGIEHGLAATMPPFQAQMSDQELHDVTAYVMEFMPAP